jgi:hypothetical protein
VTGDSAFKKQVRARMAETGENYTAARRAVIAARDPGQRWPVALRVHLNPYVDLELTSEAARAFEAADEQGRQDMANRLLADHLELAGAEEAGVAAGRGHLETAEAEQSTVAAGSDIVTLPERRIEEIAAAMIAASIHQRIPPAAQIQSISVGGDLDHVLVDIRTTRPGTVPASAEIGRLRDELEDLTGKPVLLNTLEDHPLPQERP